MSHNILVFGATGVIGKYLIQALLDSKDSFGTITAVTYPDSYEAKKDAFQKLKDQGAQIAAINIDDEDAIRKLYKGS